MHVGEANIFFFSQSVMIVATKKKNIFWILFVSSIGLLEASKETTEGAKFFKEEACKGIVFLCLYVHTLSVVLFACLFILFLLALWTDEFFTAKKLLPAEWTVVPAF